MFGDFTNEAMRSWTFVLGKFLVTNSLSLLVNDLFRFSISFLSYLAGCMFLGIYPSINSCILSFSSFFHFGHVYQKFFKDFILL